MLNKSILLNIRIAKNDMGTAIGLLLLDFVLYLIASNSIFFFSGWLILAALIIYSIFFIRVVNRVFFRSFFDDEGMLYMTLPLSAQQTVLGKILAVAGFATMMEFLILGSLMIILFFSGASVDSLLNALSAELPSLNGTKLEVSIVFGLIPLSTFTGSLFSASFILAVFLKFGLQKKKLLPCWIIYLVISTLINFGLEQVGKLFEGITLGVVIKYVIEIIFYLGVTYLLIKYSVKNLEERYDV